MVNFDAVCAGTTLTGDDPNLQLFDGAPGGHYRVHLEFYYMR